MKRRSIQAAPGLLPVALLAALQATFSHAADLPAGQATTATRAANAAVLQQLDFSDRASFDAVKRGFVAWLDSPVIRGDAGHYLGEKGVVYDASRLDFLHGQAAPDTVNPSLWRQSQLLAEPGLYRVSERIFQFRNYDAGTMTLIAGDTGWIIVDATLSAEVAAAGLKLANEKLGARPVKAVIITHSHADHFGGVLGVTTLEAIKAGKTEVIVPEGFFEGAVSENLYAGNAMSRRARYSYNEFLDFGPTQAVGAGLSVPPSKGSITIAQATRTIRQTGETMTVDGLDVVFQSAPGTEAPAEMLFYFPQLKALCVAEDANYTMHNLYTLRGAKVRSARAWADTLNTTLEMFGNDVEVAFGPHTWPTWGNASIRAFLTKQRDMYKYINDQTLRLANQGYDAVEIANRIKLPAALDKEFYNRGYYGNLKQNVRGTYDFYLGYYNGNPVTLDPLPRTESARLYVQAMGGAAQVLKLGRAAFDQGNYRWCAELVNHAVYADPSNHAARELLAAALEQLGFQAESATWRSVYLSAAKELRAPDKPRVGAIRVINPARLPLPMAVDYAATLVDPAKADGKVRRLGLEVQGTGERYTLSLENSVLFLTKPRAGEKLDATMSLKASDFGRIVSGDAHATDLVRSGAIQATGNAAALDDIVAVLSYPDASFPLVTPVDAAR